MAGFEQFLRIVNFVIQSIYQPINEIFRVESSICVNGPLSDQLSQNVGYRAHRQQSFRIGIT